MKKIFLRPALLAGLVVFLVSAAGEEKAWKKAEREDSVFAYDSYLAAYPQGAMAEEAKKRAVKISRDSFQRAGMKCDSLFPRMIYYTVAAPRIPVILLTDLAEVLETASECKFSKGLDYDQTVRSADGMIDAREVLLSVSEVKFPPRAMINYDFIALDLEEASIWGAYKKIKFCHDQSAWVDTPAKEAYKCSVPHMQVQARMVKAIADQATSDFERIRKVDDPEFRLRFWVKYKKLAKSDVIEQIAVARQFHTYALQAKAVESDPRVAAAIEEAAIRLGGSGKPRGGLPGMPY